jgi:hypothetical protein
VRSLAIWTLALFAGVATTACRRTPSRFVWGRTPAAGATSTCPEGTVDFGMERGVTTSDQARCSYADAAMGQARVTGTVLVQTSTVLGDAVEGAEVALVPIDAAGREGAAVARTTTDAQGRFDLGARARAGRWVIAVGDARSFDWTWEGKGPWTKADVRVHLAPEQ